MKRVNLSSRLMVVMLAVMVVSCSGKGGESDAARALSLARDIEGDIDRVNEAAEAYKKVAADFSQTLSGKKAAGRAQRLLSIVDQIDGFQTAHEDSLPSVAQQILSKAPNYEPILFRLGNYYAARTKLYTRAASKYRDPGMAARLLRVWSYQDSLWSGYAFRPTHKDRRMRDALCVHAVNTARMLEGLKRYEEALQVVERGLEYGSGKDELSNAKVFAAFYKFRTGDSDGAYAYAEEALQNADLGVYLQARAHHVQGLIMTYRYQDNDTIEDLDKAIKSLNAAVDLDSGIGDARALLKELRKVRGVKQAS
jgi:tetratricopeptide (TPR) repeat protein